ncbi:helix-turn-helix domain-containing protein [Longimicrobium terrae]|uniref:Excisionase family DNA binding protein n=1 Tax=Longimicrobium terrae TaxID=1639882 RepID=A0A841GRN7_9BACT|nr:helix-turn-helix domain-containing protein [Longimicrobium terrae]MBB4635426.1 excisionase family DNA binding protein [Longimicrobium terrae]MBB6069820.1 excisionase family DNA binding protein [Longimicrobium terrae]NNC30972.1 helix-turn-helix domain-containing protein [Longimicrobium terrae]NNC32742.1 helix-turn-helix domain-containing protein [Longimicrobium terrae]
MSESIGVIEPTEADVDLARQSHNRVMRAVDDPAQRLWITAQSFGKVELPHSVLGAIAAILRELAAGHTVSLQTVDDEELSTTAAAAILGMSRPTLINLLDAGEIPFRWVGSHRRITRAAVLAHQARTADGRSGPLRSRADRLADLEEMADTTHRLGLGY